MKEYSQIEIEIADYIRANPDKNREYFIAHFCKLLHKKRRTVNTLITNAKQYNKELKQDIEKAKKKALITKEEKRIEIELKKREEYLLSLQNKFERLDKLKAGDVHKDIDNETGKVIGFRQATYETEIAAIRAMTSVFETIKKVEGWDAPVKTENTIIGVNDPFSLMRKNNGID